ncbi:hypothetical protein [Aliiglaciecola sp. NS0011-25]|uniref:DUF2441 domain-containing protein n=1 Tax=Aliiglaciecola sp. NS0011-25 TaxID=3127654 RepID=UPI00310A091F
MDQFFVFLNLNNPIARTNYETRGNKIISAGVLNALTEQSYLQKYINGTLDYIPFEINTQCDVAQPSLFQLSAIDLYKIEYNAEVYRKQFLPHMPSRFSCIYAFKDYQDCIKVSKKYGWDLATVKHFKLEPNPLNKVHKVNMEVISLLRGQSYLSCLSPEEENKVWEHYWNSRGPMSIESPLVGKGDSGVIWEYLVEGTLALIE